MTPLFRKKKVGKKLSHKVSDNRNKAQTHAKDKKLELILKKNNLNFIDGELFKTIIDKNNFDYLLKLHLLGNQITKDFIKAHYDFGIQRYNDSLTSAFKVIEYTIKERLATSGNQDSSEMFKKAKEKNIISDSDYSFLFAIRKKRNNVIHGTENTSKEEASIALSIARKLIIS